MRRVLAALLSVMLAACGNGVEADHGQCLMQALQARLKNPLEQVDYVDACMAARGYQAHTAISTPLCDSSLGVRVSSCYAQPSFLDWVKIKLR